MKKAKQSDTYYHLSFVRGSADMLSVSSKVFEVSRIIVIYFLWDCKSSLEYQTNEDKKVKEKSKGC